MEKSPQGEEQAELTSLMLDPSDSLSNLGAFRSVMMLPPHSGKGSEMRKETHRELRNQMKWLYASNVSYLPCIALYKNTSCLTPTSKEETWVDTIWVLYSLVH